MNKLKTLIIGLLSVVTLGVSGQGPTFGVAELNPYFSEYLKPTAMGLATGMGGGWAQRAKTHKTLGFSLSFSAMVVKTPSSELDFNSSALSGMETDGYRFSENGTDITGTDFSMPSFASGRGTDVEFQKDLNPNGSDDVVVGVPGMDGMDLPYSPNFAIQAAVGLPKNTELIVRFVPNIGGTLDKAMGSDDVSFNELSLWGLGVKHDIKQWIPVVSKVPILEMSALLAYSKFKFDMTSSEFEINPTKLYSGDPNQIVDEFYDDDPTVYDNQGIDMQMSSLVGSILVGANIPVVHPFVGLGFNRASISTGLTGNFPEIQLFPNTTDMIEVTDIQKDALRIEDTRTFFNVQAGLNIKLAFFSFHAQYTYQQYSMYSGGIAIGLR